MYEIWRAVHILAILSWLAGLLILPRLLVYRLEGAGVDKLERMMDRAALRLQRIILTPAMLVSWLSGIILLALRFGHELPVWMWLKLLAILALTALHVLFTRWRRLIGSDIVPEPRILRLVNELPFVLAIIIVLLVVLEPAF